jgi:hypothetical protein
VVPFIAGKRNARRGCRRALFCCSVLSVAEMEIKPEVILGFIYCLVSIV